MVWHIIRADILLIARTQLAKYLHVLYAKPSNKVYVFYICRSAFKAQNNQFEFHTLRTSSSFLAPDKTLYERDTDEKQQQKNRQLQ